MKIISEGRRIAIWYSLDLRGEGTRHAVARETCGNVLARVDVCVLIDDGSNLERAISVSWLH